MPDESNKRSINLGGWSTATGQDNIPDAPVKGENWSLVIQRDPYRTWIEWNVYDSEAASTPPPRQYALDPRDLSVPEQIWQAAIAGVQPYNQAAWIAPLSEEGRAHFLEELAYNLTFAITRILSEPDLTDSDKLGRAKEVILVLRDCLAKGLKVRQKLQTWTEWDLADLLLRYAPGTLVRWAIERSHREVAEIYR